PEVRFPKRKPPFVRLLCVVKTGAVRCEAPGVRQTSDQPLCPDAVRAALASSRVANGEVIRRKDARPADKSPRLSSVESVLVYLAGRESRDSVGQGSHHHGH